jgi:hypothetical protein
VMKHIITDRNQRRGRRPISPKHLRMTSLMSLLGRDVSQEILGNRRALSARSPHGPVEPDRVPVDDGGGDAAQARHHVGYGFDFRLGAVRSRFAATRRAAASATRAHVTSSSGSSNNRSGARQKERSMVRPCFS